MKLLLLTFLFLSLVSCGGDDSGQPYEQDTFEIASDDEFQSIVSNALLSSTTPSGLGLLIKRDRNYNIDTLGTCTWFAVADDIMATNSHCIPDLLKESSSGYKCSDYIGGVVNTGYDDESVYCEEIISFSDISKDDFTQVDLAFIRINKKIQTRSFEINREGFTDLQQTTVHKIDTSSSNLSGEPILYGDYNPKICNVTMGTILGNFYDRRSTIIPAYRSDRFSRDGNCKIIGGNSGSPVSITSQSIYSASAIAFAGKANADFSSTSQNTQNTKSVSSALDEEKLFNFIKDDFKTIGNFGLFSNFACLSIPSQVNAEKEDVNCANFLKSEKDLKAQFYENLLADANLELLDFVGEYKNELSPHFQYEIKYKKPKYRLDEDLMVYATPTCYEETLQGDQFYPSYLVVESDMFALDDNAKIVPKITTKHTRFSRKRANIQLGDVWRSETYTVKYQITREWISESYSITPCEAIP